jgi:SAM-dependent methyltransferase
MQATGRANLDRLVAAVVAQWPDHARALEKAFRDADGAFLDGADDLARRILLLAAGDLDEMVASYRWTCAEISRETLFFRKHGRYRRRTFAEADAEVYANAGYMKRYMQGLLLSQILWRNHCGAFLAFRDRFLSQAATPFRYLEVGPGHGLFLSLAAEAAGCTQAEGWDVSEESLRQTEAALKRFGTARRVRLAQRDVLAGDPGGADASTFDLIAISEVLEHLEAPVRALEALRRRLAPGGRIFINVPINSPAPDHIWLVRDGDEARALAEAAGLSVVEQLLLPMGGYSLEDAVRHRVTISCVMIAE